MDSNEGFAVTSTDVSSAELMTLVGDETQRHDVASPTFVAGLSTFVMGLGQFYNGQMRAAKVFFAGQLCLMLYVYDYWAAGEVSTAVISWTSPFVYGFFMSLLVGGGVVVWLFNVYDAYSTAKFCEMIYDRTLPSLDDDDEELLAAHLRTTTFGVEHGRGLSRQMVYGASALFLYSAAIFLLGSHFSGSSHRALDALRQRIAQDGTDAFSRLQLGELLMADGNEAEAAREFREVVRHSQDPTWTCAAATSLARIHRRMGDDDGAREMLRLAAEAAARTTGRVAVPPTPIAPPTTAVPATVRPAAVPSTLVSVEEVNFALDKARTDLDVGQPAEAVRTLRDIEARGAASATVVGLLSSALLAAGDTDGARATAERAVALDPSEPAALRTRVLLAVAADRPEAMEAALDAYVAVRPADAEAAVAVAQSLYRSKRLAEAYRVASSQLTRTPGNPELLLLTFKVARDEGRQSQAYEAGLALVEAEYRDVDVYRFLAETARRRGEPEAALRFARALAVLEPGKGQWLVLQGELLEDRRSWREALEAYRNALVVTDGDVDVYVRMARVAREVRAFDDAVTYLNEAVERRPRDVALLKQLAELQQARGTTAEALATYQKALAIDGTSLELKYLVGMLSVERGDGGGAYDVLKTVFGMAPTYRDVAYYYGRAAEDVGRRDDAVAAYRRVGDTSPNADDAAARLAQLQQSAMPPATPSSPPLHTAAAVPLGDVDAPPVPVEQYAEALKQAELAFRDGRYAEAVTAYDRVLAVMPTHFRSLYQEGVALTHLGRQAEAVTVLQKAKVQNPDDMDLLMQLGNVFADVGRYDEAITEFETAVRLDPKHLAARYNLGWLFEKRKQYDKAEEHYKAIAWFYPEYVKAYDFLGNLYFVQGKYEQALTNFEKLLAVDDDDETVRFKSALTLLQLGRNEQARREFLFLRNTLESDHPLAPKVNEYVRKLR